MRRLVAPTSALTDARGHNERPALTAWQRQTRAVVSTYGLQSTGAGVSALAPVTTSTHPSKRTQLKLARSLSLRSLGKSTYGADNERSTLRQADSNHRCANGRALDNRLGRLGERDGVVRIGPRCTRINWPLFWQRLCEGKLGDAA
jgi:hypothetical protein